MPAPGAGAPRASATTVPTRGDSNAARHPVKKEKGRPRPARGRPFSSCPRGCGPETTPALGVGAPRAVLLPSRHGPERIVVRRDDSTPAIWHVKQKDAAEDTSRPPAAYIA